MSKRYITFFNLWVLLWHLLGYGTGAAQSLETLVQKNEMSKNGWQTSSIAPINQLLEKKYLVDSNYNEYNQFGSETTPSSAVTDYAKGLQNLGINLHSGPQSENNIATSSLNHCKSLVYKTLKSLPSEATSTLKNLTLSFENDARRGLGGGSTIILRCENVTDEELVSVLVHEMGHVVDTGLIEGNSSAKESEFRDGNDPVYNNDPSLEFYRLSFVSGKTRKTQATKLDFVTGYAMTDPYEDFAESYNYYILHGGTFREMARGNEILQKKYNYLKTRVFKGEEYFLDDEARIGEAKKADSGSKTVSVGERQYDATLVPYDLNKFMFLGY